MTAELKMMANGQFLLSGSLTFETVVQLEKQSHQLFASQSAIIVDLGKIIFSDSSGLALLAEWMRNAKKHNMSIQYLNIPQQMQAIADVTGLRAILPLNS